MQETMEDLVDWWNTRNAAVETIQTQPIDVKTTELTK